MSEVNNHTIVQDNIIQRDPTLLIEEIIIKDPRFEVKKITEYIRNTIGDDGVFFAESMEQSVDELGGEQGMLVSHFTKVNCPELYALFDKNNIMHNLTLDLPNKETVTVYISNDE